MKNQEMTPWFPATINPVRVGIYECRRIEGAFHIITRKLRWNGIGWEYPAHNEIGLRDGHFARLSARDGDVWRGLAREPS
jgi:hypothetical protein